MIGVTFDQGASAGAIAAWLALNDGGLMAATLTQAVFA